MICSDAERKELVHYLNGQQVVVSANETHIIFTFNNKSEFRLAVHDTNAMKKAAESIESQKKTISETPSVKNKPTEPEKKTESITPAERVMNTEVEIAHKLVDANDKKNESNVAQIIRYLKTQSNSKLSLEIANSVGIERSTVSATLYQMYKKGMIVRERDKTYPQKRYLYRINDNTTPNTESIEEEIKPEVKEPVPVQKIVHELTAQEKNKEYEDKIYSYIKFNKNCQFVNIEDDLKLSQSVISYAISRLSKSKKIGARTDYDVRENIKRVYYYAVA